MRIHWRSLIMAVLCWVSLGTAWAASADAKNNAGHTILVVGDSLSAEYGIARGSGWVALTAQRLKSDHQDYQIRNASISGDTTSGGLARLPVALQTHMPAIVIIELGSNDALRGLSLDMTEQNLETMITLSQQGGAKVLLVGMQIPPNYGKQYADRFRDMYVALAQRTGVALVPFLLEGMATDPAMFLSDGIHPNEDAQALLAKNVWQHLAPLL
ncbi:arylesterase [Pollutimonas thiosulfatoxidans]|uniref:Arylesterase n=1 Tax=Pollutimonas thiosulfatoxidans TaxID=2028345 RepID=A0A410GB30_9BURK|nr:arylesterase [Pollutimonas thiosulfatoxidans]QAA93498.1 arylesterase [Pollutimonas thiosulfatoxidans]